MKSMIKELWHGNIIPQEDSRNNSKEIFEKFHDCWDEYVSLAETAIFEYAFKLGSRLIYEALCEHSE